MARTEGNPFFLEESVRTLVETGVLVGEPGAYRLAQAVPTIQVPATVQAVLAARIDRLPPEEKRLLQTAAVIGTEVPLALLQAIAELPDETLHRGLAHLQAAEFLYETRLFPERDLTFKHALTHEVAYGGLLQERRRVLHARIVEALEALAGDRLAEQVERLAHHALRGRGVGQGPGLRPAGGGEGHGALGLPRGRGVLRAGAGGPGASAGDARHARAGHRSPARPPHGPLALGRALSVSWRLCVRPRPWRRPWTIRVGSDGSRSFSQYFLHGGAYDQAIAAGQRALALATASGEVVLHAHGEPILGRSTMRPMETIAGPSTASGRPWFCEGARRHERFGHTSCLP